MEFTPKKFNAFLALKLPSAWLCGVRVQQISDEKCTTSVKLKWINQNPFKSMFWAVQGMAAELATGVLVMQAIQNSNQKISMLVASNSATFHKKAKGKIEFLAFDDHEIKTAITQTLATGEGQIFTINATGIDEEGDTVSEFSFVWTIKLKK
ncbi:protein of unknown function [Pustulibacterium marinum]|uniref:Acyl-coenzyme A thioesterase PaaI, contains HGG motif n=1 Tax=Pustulibacterium marinum TaxID=1224947 RepID=A0A1I7H3J9_9FLAO|nr:DUF4442 domain-containing protein [Pustulibacterium marinum]SFU55285.1 protein of unknown function [Pustulibacterium marinum]